MKHFLDFPADAFASDIRHSMSSDQIFPYGPKHNPQRRQTCGWSPKYFTCPGCKLFRSNWVSQNIQRSHLGGRTGAGVISWKTPSFPVTPILIVIKSFGRGKIISTFYFRRRLVVSPVCVMLLPIAIWELSPTLTVGTGADSFPSKPSNQPARQSNNLQIRITMFDPG